MRLNFHEEHKRRIKAGDSRGPHADVTGRSKQNSHDKLNMKKHLNASGRICNKIGSYAMVFHFNASMSSSNDLEILVKHRKASARMCFTYCQLCIKDLGPSSSSGSSTSPWSVNALEEGPRSCLLLLSERPWAHHGYSDAMTSMNMGSDSRSGR